MNRRMAFMASPVLGPSQIDRLIEVGLTTGDASPTAPTPKKTTLVRPMTSNRISRNDFGEASPASGSSHPGRSRARGGRRTRTPTPPLGGSAVWQTATPPCFFDRLEALQGAWGGT